jgi:hypothetical protein
VVLCRFEWFCADCDKSFNDFLDEIGDEYFLPNFIQWAANRARDVLKKEIREILKYWENEKRSDNALMALNDISELVGYFEE